MAAKRKTAKKKTAKKKTAKRKSTVNIFVKASLDKLYRAAKKRAEAAERKAKAAYKAAIKKARKK